MSDPKPLKELLEYGRDWDEDEGGVWVYSAADWTVIVEMARRLRKLDEMHQPEINTRGTETGICKSCEEDWPCPDRAVLDGRKP